MDLTTLRLEVRERIGELEADFFTDVEVDRAINEAIRRFSNEERWPWLTVEFSDSLADGVDTLALPSGVPPNRIFNLSVDGDTLIQPRVLERVNADEGFRLRHAWSGHESRPRWYYVHMTNLDAEAEAPVVYTIRFIPVPEADYTVEGQYLLVPNDLSGGSDEPQVPTEYQDAIPAWAAGKLFLKEQAVSQKANEQFAIYRNVVEQARTEMFETNVDQTIAWGREHPGEGVVHSEYEYVMGRVPPTLGS